MTWEGYYTRSRLLRGTETAVHMFFKISVTPKQMFSGEFCKTFKNTFSLEQLRWLLYKKQQSLKCFLNLSKISS